MVPEMPVEKKQLIDVYIYIIQPHDSGSRYTYILYMKPVVTGLDLSMRKVFNNICVHITGTCFFVQWKIAVVQ